MNKESTAVAGFPAAKAGGAARQAALRGRRHSGKLPLLALNIVVALFLLLPLLYAVSVAFMSPGELFTTELNLWPKQPTLQNFYQAFQRVPLFRFVANSFIVATAITLGQIISCSLAAFAFSFLEFKGKTLLFMLVMATMMVPV